LANPKPRKKPAKKKPLSWRTVQKLALRLPEAEESTSYGTPAFKVRGKLFVRLREEGDVIVVRIEMADRAMRMAANPSAYFLTDHYVPYPYMLVRLSEVDESELAELLDDAWRIVGGVNES